MNTHIKNATKLTGIGLLFYFAIVSKNTPEAFAATSLTDCSMDLDEVGETYTLANDITGTCTITANNITIDGQDLYTITGDVVADALTNYDGFNITLQNITVTGAVTSESGYYGNAGDIVVTNSTTGNVSTNSFYDGGTVTITNSTISGNIDARGGVYGDGGGGDVYLTNSTISGNIDARSGVYGDGGDVYLTNTTGVVNINTSSGDDGGDITLIDSPYSGTLTYNGGGYDGIVTITTTTTTPAPTSSAPSDTIKTTCKLSDTTITTDEEVDIEVTASMHKSKLPYTFKWTNDMTGDDKDFSHTFDTPGTYVLRGMVENNERGEKVVRCDEIVVTQADDEEDTSSGSGSSSSSSRNNNEDTDDADEDTTEEDTSSVSNTATVATPTFTTSLSNGSEGQSVRELQTLLNNINFTLAETGAGSPGNETNYYGQLTTNAVTRFQETFGVTSADGTLNQQTRDWLNLIMMFR